MKLKSSWSSTRRGRACRLPIILGSSRYFRVPFASSRSNLLYLIRFHAIYHDVETKSSRGQSYDENNRVLDIHHDFSHDLRDSSRWRIVTTIAAEINAGSKRLEY